MNERHDLKRDLDNDAMGDDRDYTQPTEEIITIDEEGVVHGDISGIKFTPKPESVASIVGAMLYRVALTGEHSGAWGNNKYVEKATQAILELHKKLLCCVTIEHASDLLARERDWWHRNFHQATGIPCDGTLKECKRAVQP